MHHTGAPPDLGLPKSENVIWFEKSKGTASNELKFRRPSGVPTATAFLMLNDEYINQFVSIHAIT
jgi:hypothetical protein